jgi:hypothetical protein
LNFLDIFSKNPEISNFINSVQWEPSFSMKTDMMKVTVAFRCFAKAPTMAQEFEYIWNIRNVWLEVKKMKPVLCLEFQNIRMRQVLEPYPENSRHWCLGQKGNRRFDYTYEFVRHKHTDRFKIKYSSKIFICNHHIGLQYPSHETFQQNYP